eukprot:3628154-Pleurochrysis_carterae.AAC.1
MVSSARRAASRPSVKSPLVMAAMSNGVAPPRVRRLPAARASFSKNWSNSRVPRVETGLTRCCVARARPTAG